MQKGIPKALRNQKQISRDREGTSVSTSLGEDRVNCNTDSLSEKENDKVCEPQKDSY